MKYVAKWEFTPGELINPDTTAWMYENFTAAQEDVEEAIDMLTDENTIIEFRCTYLIKDRSGNLEKRFQIMPFMRSGR